MITSEVPLYISWQQLGSIYGPARSYMRTGVPRSRKLAPPPQDHRRALGIGLLHGLRGWRFLMSEVPLCTCFLSAGTLSALPPGVMTQAPGWKTGYASLVNFLDDFIEIRQSRHLDCRGIESSKRCTREQKRREEGSHWMVFSGLPRSEETASPWDPTVSQCLVGPEGGPRGGGSFL